MRSLHNKLGPRIWGAVYQSLKAFFSDGRRNTPGFFPRVRHASPEKGSLQPASEARLLQGKRASCFCPGLPDAGTLAGAHFQSSRCASWVRIYDTANSCALRSMGEPVPADLARLARQVDCGSDQSLGSPRPNLKFHKKVRADRGGQEKS